MKYFVYKSILRKLYYALVSSVTLRYCYCLFAPVRKPREVGHLQCLPFTQNAFNAGTLRTPWTALTFMHIWWRIFNTLGEQLQYIHVSFDRIQFKTILHSHELAFYRYNDSMPYWHANCLALDRRRYLKFRPRTFPLPSKAVCPVIVILSGMRKLTIS